MGKVEQHKSEKGRAKAKNVLEIMKGRIEEEEEEHVIIGISFHHCHYLEKKSELGI